MAHSNIGLSSLRVGAFRDDRGVPLQSPSDRHLRDSCIVSFGDDSEVRIFEYESVASSYEAINENSLAEEVRRFDIPKGE